MITAEKVLGSLDSNKGMSPRQVAQVLTLKFDEHITEGEVNGILKRAKEVNLVRGGPNQYWRKTN